MVSLLTVLSTSLRKKAQPSVLDKGDEEGEFLHAHAERAWKFFQSTFGQAKLYWCAPMVGASELAFRMMTRDLGCNIATTPMAHACGYARSENYRKQALQFAPEDRPLIVQFCGNNIDSLIQASKLVEDKCDAVEINLGCPQKCARKGNFGAFLMTEYELLYNMISRMNKELKIPVLIKTRIFPTWEETRRYVRMLQAAGCWMLTVHGRIREDKRKGNVPADWDMIARVKQELKIPVVSNGNIRNFQDVVKCLEYTKCDGVMSACGLLTNPALFDRSPRASTWTDVELGKMYLDYAVKYRATRKHIGKHLFCILKRKFRAVPEAGNVLVEFCKSGKGKLMSDRADEIDLKPLYQAIDKLYHLSSAPIEDELDEDFDFDSDEIVIDQKTKDRGLVCRYWLRGHCRDGDSCRMLHRQLCDKDLQIDCDPVAVEKE